jgi:hypothetical protein
LRLLGAALGRDIFGAMAWLTWSLLSALFAAATAILAKLGVAGVDANVVTAVRTTVVVLFSHKSTMDIVRAGACRKLRAARNALEHTECLALSEGHRDSAAWTVFRFRYD